MRRAWILAVCLLVTALLRDAASAPEAVVALNERGLAHLAGGRPGEAAVQFEEALARLPDDPILRRNLAFALAELAEGRRRARKPVEAVELLDRAIQLHPERLHYRLLRGRARFAAGRTVDRILAREDFVHVLEQDPDQIDALANLGQLSYLERRLEEAARLWRHALRLRPNDLDLRSRLARAQRELDVERAYDELSASKFVVRHGPTVPRSVAEAVLTLCEAAYDELCTRFQHWPETRTVVTLYSPDEFRAATRLHAWVAGLSDGTLRLTVRPGSSAERLRAVVYHEYAHHLIRGIAARAPAWLHEGLAQLAENRSVRIAEARLRKAEDLRALDLSERILAQRDSRRVERFYDMALSFTEYLLQQGGGERALHELLRCLGEGKGEHTALKRAYGASREELVARWLRSLRGG